jgi:hypothetical protein
VGNDAASSAQSKCAGGGETARLGLSRVEQGCAGGNGGIDGEQGVSMVVDSEMACCWGFWGELGVWDMFRGCFAGSSCVCRCSGAASGGPELGRAGDSVFVNEHVDGDMAVVLGVSGRAGVWGARWGEVGGVRSFLGHRSELDGGRGHFVEQTTRSDKHVFSSSHNSVLRAVVLRCMLFSAW